jgi:aryl-alcohol dehydrogenase-like predicted oxidoreductase
MKTIQLGQDGPVTSPLGLGCMGMSDFYGPADDAESLRTLHAAIEAGMNLLDTGDFYGMGHNEMLIGQALKHHDRSKLLLSVKFGAQRDPGGNFVGLDTRPSAIKSALAYTLKRLGTDHIDIYRPARLDDQVPIEDTVGAIADMVKAGYVRHIGLSEMGSETIRRAAAVHPICDLQIEYSVLSRGIEDSVLKTCRALGIGITAYGVLSRGLIGGNFKPNQFTKGDFRSYSPRFQAGNLEQNQTLIDRLQSIAQDKGVSVAQLAIAWVAAQGPDILPLVGTRQTHRLADALKSLDVVLSASDLAAIDLAVPKGAAVGTRYAQLQMSHLDSERG